MRPLLALCFGLLLALSAPAQSRFDLTEVNWVMRPDAAGDFIDMEMRLAPLHERERVLLRMPWWMPGSYSYSNFERKVSDLQVTDQEGAERSILALDDRTWEVASDGATELTVRYRLAVQNQADDGAMPAVRLHSPAAFLYTEDSAVLPHTLRFELPEGWSHASGHRPHPERADVYYSPNFDVFIDCPIVVGEMEHLSFEAEGRPFEIILYGKRPSEAQFPREDWVRKVKAISEAGYQVMGEYPFERYWYLFGFTDIGGGYGLEHLNSTTIEFNHRMVKNGNLDPLESVTAHEFIHLWNVKRIRPAQLGPFDYSTDVRTRDLWWMEGITSYYNDVMLQRAGLRDDNPRWFLDSQMQNQANLGFSRGYGRISAERSSWTIWDGREQVSYYDQGQALGWLLDIQIRHHTGNERSLDDVQRALARWIDYPNVGLRQDDLQKMVYAVSGWDCSEFFDRYVAGNLKYPYAEVLPLAGLDLVAFDLGDPYLGIGMDDDLKLTIKAEMAEFREGDRLVAVDGQKVSSTADVRAAAATLTPNEEVTLKVRRGTKNIELRWTVKERTRSYFHIRENDNATTEQRAIHQGILTGTPQSV